MNRTQRLALAAVVVLLHVSAAFSALAQLLSPGELSRAHHALEGDDRCVDCHSQGRRVDTARCSHCHDDIGKDLQHKRGLHGTTYRGKQCGECHVEHRGLAHDLVRWPGGAPARFDHASTGFPLRGAHATQGCTDCHGKRKNARGAATFLGLSRACKSCHEDPHQGRFGDTCQSCHGEDDFKRARLDRFDHDLARFALHGKHAGVKCAGCHGEPPRYRGLEFGSCKSCHQDPHQGRFGDACAGCHSEQAWSKVSMKRSAHPGLSLGGGHRKVRCGACHDQGVAAPPKAGSRCVGCHKPVHEADFGKNCRHCHKRIEWMGVTEELARSVHDKTPFALEGAHASVACDHCHDPKQAPAARYRELEFARCLDCHDDPHAREFASRDGGECAPCHTPHGFTPTRFGLLAHAETSFALDGGHAAVPCKRCHGDAHPRLDLRVAAHECADCHATPHGDQFDAEMRDGGCAHCHATSAWNRPRVDHSRWPLTGAHAEAACGACHDATEADQKAGGGASYRGLPRNCEGCHEDVHAGQFRLSEPVRGCDHCHTTDRFDIETFDHASRTGYALEGKHAKVECKGCHALAELRNGHHAVRYRLGYRACADCHADPHSGAEP